MRIVSEPVLVDLLAARLADRPDRPNGPERPDRPPLIVAAGNFATPTVAVGALDRALSAYRLFVLNAQHGVPERPGVTPVTPFVGPGMREHRALEYLPCRLSMVPRLFTGAHRPDAVILHTSRPVDGKVSMGTEVNILPAAVEAVRSSGGLVIAQTNSRMPYTFGDGELSCDEVDLALEVDVPLASPAFRQTSDIHHEIGARVAALVADGATLQLGIGAVPDATLAALTGGRRLRVWTETFSDGVLALDRSGALAADAELVTSFVFGSGELYAWLDRNSRVRLLRTETVNDPGTIARQPGMTSINTALQIDLHAQANASFVRGRVWSGFGGQPDFVTGALHATGGRAIIALPSWHSKTGRSTVVRALAEPTTSFQHSHVISEHGTAQLWGRGQEQQARDLIEHVAHPAARPGLREAGAEGHTDGRDAGRAEGSELPA
ncbi:acetyl-CoA hydrolase/transferase C-terminal domain-containing protein [Parafrankia sp. EAN1pec]|uniref:acetyl-CoA hydrolase/transferase family protein n=1 Tax=Parafrankia sp. (strain EAN1pec) TaxID=298653 RepID=UPI0026A17FD2